MENVEKEVTNNRSSRGIEQRSAHSRVSDERPPIVFGGGTRFNLPASVVKKLHDSNRVPGFVVYSSSNQDQKENYYDAVDRGYKPLRAEEFPELARQYELSPFDSKEETQLIRRGGQVCMVRDEEIHNAENDYYDEAKRRDQYLADMYKQTDPRYPKPFADERTRHRVRS